MTRILITGAGGTVGQALIGGLNGHDILATDLRPIENAPFARLDVTTRDAMTVIGRFRPDVVVHLASIVTPPRGMSRETAFKVDVEGTLNVIEACAAHGVRRLVVTSSGAAYGYHADNPVPLREGDPLRGNAEFAYADHKRRVEAALAEARSALPGLEQVVLRVGTVLGPGVENQITALFHKRAMLAVRGYDSPFVFIWTQDLARVLVRAATDGPAGIFNVAGDGAVSPAELAVIMGKPLRALPAWLLRAALAVAHPIGLSRYGPEQVRFLQFRPVLDNTRLKSDFGIVPSYSSREAFVAWWQQARQGT
ncbi:MAG: SDR family oxidoreductase [Paracoccaceae bacterium]